MAVDPLVFTKDWNNSSDFPAIEPSEIQARADLQLLHDEAKTKINELIADYNTNISSALTTTDIDNAIS